MWIELTTNYLCYDVAAVVAVTAVAAAVVDVRASVSGHYFTA